MKYPYHLAIGFLMVALAFWLLDYQKIYHFNPLSNFFLSIQILVAAAVFSMLPDIDSSSSNASKALRLVFFLISLLSAIEFAITKNNFALARSVVALVVLIVHFAYARSDFLHRRFPHSFTFGALACIAVFLLTASKLVAFAAAIAFFSHILADWHVLNALRNDKRLWLGK